MARILLTEDEGPKRAKIRALLSQMDLDDDVQEARSVSSAVQALRHQKFDLVVLDMSLPTFDIDEDATGGRPQGFGGVEVLRYMNRFEISTPVIVVTAFEAFADGTKHMDLPTLEDNLRKDHPNTFREMVFYNSMFSTWRDDLRSKIERVVSE